MDLQQKQQITQLSPLQSTKFKTKTNGGAATAAKKFVGVRRRPSGRWVAEIKDTTQKIRMWLGTFETAEAAALAYDEAACLLRGSNTRTNFSHRRPSAAKSPVATRIRKLLHHKKLAGDGDDDCNSSPQHHKNASFLPSAAAAASSIGGTTPAWELEQGMYRPWFAKEAYEAMFNGFDLSESDGGFLEICGDGGGGGGGVAEEVGVFERMRVERQISASLYAMNGVQEYFEAMQEFSVSSSLLESVWDFPPFL